MSGGRRHAHGTQLCPSHQLFRSGVAGAWSTLRCDPSVIMALMLPITYVAVIRDKDMHEHTYTVLNPRR